MTMPIDQTRVYMTVKAAPLLQNEQVCNFLEEMNQEEITKTAQEEEPLNTHLSELDKAYSWTVIIGDGVWAALGLGGIISTTKYSYDHSPYAKNVYGGVQLMTLMLRAGITIYHLKKNKHVSKRQNKNLSRIISEEKKREKKMLIKKQGDGFLSAPSLVGVQLSALIC